VGELFEDSVKIESAHVHESVISGFPVIISAPRKPMMAGGDKTARPAVQVGSYSI
jgi:hypothetical protein